MMRSVLIGLVAGSRSMLPLAAVADAALTGRLAPDNGLGRPMGATPLAVGAFALAGNEWVMDRTPGTPDRTRPEGIAFRVASGAYAGAALASRRTRWLAGALAGLAAAGSAFVTLELRMAAQERFGKEAAARLEDALAALAAGLVVHLGEPPHG